MKCIVVSPYGIDADSIPAGTHFAGDSIKFESLAADQKGLLVDYLDLLGRDDLSRRVRTKPVYVIPSPKYSFASASKPDEQAETLLYLHRFSMEVFTGEQVAMAAFTFDDDKVTGHAFEMIDLLGGNAAGVVITKADWDAHLKYLDFLYLAIKGAPLAPLAIRRLGRALRFGPTADGIVDLSIALECLVNAQNEIRFQFALNHSLTNTDELDKREALFALLQMLYDVRSKSVHGGELEKSDKKKLSEVMSKWNSLIDACQNSITYYLLFCKEKTTDKLAWYAHLRALALGGNRISVED